MARRAREVTTARPEWRAPSRRCRWAGSGGWSSCCTQTRDSRVRCGVTGGGGESRRTGARCMKGDLRGDPSASRRARWAAAMHLAANASARALGAAGVELVRCRDARRVPASFASDSPAIRAVIAPRAWAWLRARPRVSGGATVLGQPSRRHRARRLRRALRCPPGTRVGEAGDGARRGAAQPKSRCRLARRQRLGGREPRSLPRPPAALTTSPASPTTTPMRAGRSRPTRGRRRAPPRRTASRR